MIQRMVNRLLSNVKHWLDSGNSFQNSLFIAFFTLSLTFFIHFREVRLDHLELHSTANKYVLAQVEFDFADVERTRILREESLHDVGLIYYLDDEEIVKAEQKIQDELINSSEWRKQFPSLTFEDVIKACDAMRHTLFSVEFCDERTVQKLEQMGIHKYRFIPSDISNIDTFWNAVYTMTFTTPSDASRLIFDSYRNYPWQIKEDFEVRHLLRRKIKDQIPVKMTHVAAGTRIIDAGEVVTRRHLSMLQQMKKVLTDEIQLLKPMTMIGSFVFSAILLMFGFIYLYKFHLPVFRSVSKVSLIGVVILTTLTLAKLSDYFILHQPGHLVDMCRFPLYILFPSIILSILIDRTVALMVSGFIAIVLGITLAMESHDFLIMNLSTAVMGIIWAKGVSRRKEIIVICSKVWLSCIPLILALHLLDNDFGSRQMLNDLVTTCVYSFATAILVVAVLPLLESAFGIVTDMTLMEAGDPHHPLLRRLGIEAPGTYQHSLGVANLAEAAALSIGANALLCRISSLYHDIGKIIQPNYFTENLREGFDMHQLLTPLESAQVIIQHVTEGIKLAENANLPKPIIDIIREHHGTTLVYYFYNAHIEKRRGKSIGVEEGFFHYPGPTPQSRESAIVMIADSIEAASRCQLVVDAKVISDLVESIVADKIRDHQLDSSGLTFDDIESIKKSIFRSLMAVNHIRPAFPSKPKVIITEKIPI